MKVLLTSEAAVQLDELPDVIHARMLKMLDRLAKWPDVSGSRPLRGALAGQYRVRTGDYRLQFRIGQGKIIIERIGHRDGFYGE
jgi:mRNA-degrading endonuclease RelE of RelBE toxin-antitoxin system